VSIATRPGAEALASAITRRIGEPRYKLWFERHTRFRHDGDRLTVGVPNRHFEEWLEKTFGAAVAESAAEVFGEVTPVRFVIDPELFQAARREQEEVNASRGAIQAGGMRNGERGMRNEGRKTGATASASSSIPHSTIRVPHSDGPEYPTPDAKRSRRWRRLADFVVGPCNRVAHASALSAVEAPADAASPLVIHGPVGTGKTHLLEGICAGLRKAHPGWRVLCLTSEEFTNRFVQAMRFNRLAAFRKQFRDCDALLIDDLQFLATKKVTQEEFLHTFDALQADGRVMVFTCDCHPRLADDFSPELADRLLGGAVWGLAPPDAQTRLGILRALAGRAAPVLPDPVLQFLATQLRGNVRELEGAVQSIRHYARVTARAVDVALVREALADLLRHAVRVVQLADVERAVCQVLRMEGHALRGKGRAWAVSHPRMVAMYLARKHTAASYSEIGGHFGGRNHSTVVAGEKKVRAWLQDDAELALGERRIGVRELVERAERELLR
jgi:chromosomal replication initiator protein